MYDLEHRAASIIFLPRSSCWNPDLLEKVFWNLHPWKPMNVPTCCGVAKWLEPHNCNRFRDPSKLPNCHKQQQMYRYSPFLKSVGPDSISVPKHRRPERRLCFRSQVTNTAETSGHQYTNWSSRSKDSLPINRDRFSKEGVLHIVVSVAGQERSELWRTTRNDDFTKRLIQFLTIIKSSSELTGEPCYTMTKDNNPNDVPDTSCGVVKRYRYRPSARIEIALKREF